MSSLVDCHAGIVGREPTDPVVVALVRRVAADHDDLVDLRELVDDRVEDRHEVRADDQHLGVGVVDDELHLRRGQAPVDVDADGVQHRRAERHVEVLDAVLVEEGDPVVRADARSRPAPARPVPSGRADPST